MRNLHFKIAALIAIAAPLAMAQTPLTLDKVKASGSITVAYRDSSIPFSYLDDKAQPVGFGWEICGKIVDAALVRKGVRVATNLRFQPYGTFELYTEQVLLCGPPSQDLIDKSNGPIILTYRRTAHEAVDGISCHDLEAVFSVGKQE